jgi:hypothetical protein
MISRGALLFLVVSVSAAFAAASEIRQFDHRTTERLGNELVAASKRADRGASTPAKKQAKQTATAALRGKLYDGLRYDYVVVDDPAGSGFLVYALARAKRKGDVIAGDHFRRRLRRWTDRFTFAVDSTSESRRGEHRCRDRFDPE